MAMAAYGSSVDVLVGGDDLVFPHHAYQSAMVTTVTGVTPFARASLHVGEVRLDGVKMAKSTGNLVLVDEVLASCTPQALRLLLLNRPYGEPWSYEPGLLAEAEALLQRLYAAAGRTGEGADRRRGHRPAARRPRRTGRARARRGRGRGGGPPPARRAAPGLTASARALRAAR